MTTQIQRDVSVVPTRFWVRQPDGRVQCQVCPRGCRLTEGQRGACWIRGCLDGEVVLTGFGRTSGLAVDPIEKKPLYHFLPGSHVFSFGTAGCNLACAFCQNWNISTSRTEDLLCVSASPEAITEAALREGCRSVAFTYNDPVVFMEYAIAVAEHCRPRGIKTVAVTAGYHRDAARREFYRHIDAANIDLKAFSETFYRKLCGAHLQDVLDALVYVQKETPVWLEVTTLLIPGENDSDAELEAMTEWMVRELGPEVPLHFTAFHPAHKMRYYPSTPFATLTRARAIARKRGLRYVYTGNVRDTEGASTSCHACGRRVIGRDGFRITEQHVSARGTCTFCGAALPGVW